MQKTAKLILLAVVALVSLSSIGYTQDEVCVNKLKSCFTLEDSRRDRCFQSAAKLPECRRTHDGDLASKRGLYSSLSTAEANDSTRGMLRNTPPEPIVFDRKCVENFDTLWLSHLVNEDHTPDTCQRLSAALKECLRDSEFDLGRP